MLVSLPAALLATLVLGLGCLALGPFDRSGRQAHRLARAWGRLLLWLWGVEVLVRGKDHLPSGPAVYAANHASTLDIPLLFGHLPVDFRIIHKRSLYLIPLVGLCLYLGGHVGIDRRNPFRARRSLAAAAARIGRGTSLAVFPEGTRSPDDAIRPFKRGSFLLALEAGVPIVPLSLAGVKRLVPRGLLRLRPGTVRLTIHPPLGTSGRGPEAAVALGEEVRQIVRGGCDEG